jgi:hypothetical protein
MSAPKDELLQAVELALAGEWDAAHNLVQQYEVGRKVRKTIHELGGTMPENRKPSRNYLVGWHAS